MATLQDLISKVRFKLYDFTINDSIAEDITSTQTEFLVNDVSLYSDGMLIEIDDEGMIVKDVDTTNGKVTVYRGVHGTTAISHSVGTTIQIYRFWLNSEIKDAINVAIRSLYPALFRVKKDSSLTTVTPSGDSNIVEYDVSSITPEIKEILSINILDKRRDFEYLPDLKVLRLRAYDSGYTIEIIYKTGFTTLSSLTDELDDEINDSEIVEAIVLYASAILQESRLNLRTRFTEYSASLDDRAATIGQYIGVAGYLKFQYDKIIEKRRMVYSGRLNRTIYG